MPGHFEAKKHAYRQTQDGIVVSFVIHPNDLNAEFAVAALGTRYMVAFAEIGDDEKPQELARAGDEYRPEPNEMAKPNADKAEPQKDRRPFSSLPLSQQAAIRCGDTTFQEFVGASNSDVAADYIRKYCKVGSRADIHKGMQAAIYWESLEGQFQDWLTTKRYADARR